MQMRTHRIVWLNTILKFDAYCRTTINGIANDTRKIIIIIIKAVRTIIIQMEIVSGPGIRWTRSRFSGRRQRRRYADRGFPRASTLRRDTSRRLRRYHRNRREVTSSKRINEHSDLVGGETRFANGDRRRQRRGQRGEKHAVRYYVTIIIRASFGGRRTFICEHVTRRFRC